MLNPPLTAPGVSAIEREPIPSCAASTAASVIDRTASTAMSDVLSIPAAIPAGIQMPTWSRMTRDGEWIPSADFTKSGRALTTPFAASRTALAALRIPVAMPPTMSRPMESIRSGMPRTTPMMSDPIDWKNPTTVLIPAEIPFLMPSQMVETMRPIPLQAASQMLRIRFTAFVMMELTMLIAPTTMPLMTSQAPERICLMPSHAALQSPLMIAVTVLMMPTTILRAPWTIGTIACTTVTTTFRTA